MTARDRVLSSLPRLGCGACGAPTCEAFAEDVVRGEITEDACVFLRLRHIEATVKELAGLVRRQVHEEQP
jgi:CO dehydrogenase/acetyl-CoA synthase gamma subunit (corrinoid Fe-S protein)